MLNNPNYKVTNYMANRKIYAAAVLLKKLIFLTIALVCRYNDRANMF